MGDLGSGIRSLQKRSVSIMVLLLCLMVLGAAKSAKASNVTITTTVAGNQGPWSQSLNPSDNYGVGDNSSPDAITSASGISFAAGGTITISYLSGTVSAGSGFAFVDAGGNTAFPFNNLPGSSGKVAPSFFMNSSTYPIYLTELVGTFADNGVIVGTPFAIGDGATLTVPAGANQLLLGANDDIYSDNAGSWTLSVTGPAASVGATPEPGSLFLLASGLLALAPFLRRFAQS